MGEKIVNGFLFLLSTMYLYFAGKLSFGDLSYPKAGFMPQVIGWLAVIVSGYLFIQAMRNKGDAKNVKLEIDWKRLFLLIVVMVAYIALLKQVGYLICSAVALFAVLKIAQVKGWKLPLTISVLASASFYLVFKILLEVPLPAGILG